MSGPDEQDRAGRQDVRKTHDLDTLAELARRHWPGLVAAPFALSYLSRGYIVSRYPGDDDIGPTAGEVQVAWPAVDALLSAVIAQAPEALADEIEAVRQGGR